MTSSTFHALLLSLFTCCYACVVVVAVLLVSDLHSELLVTTFQAERTPFASGSEKNVSIDRSVPETLSPVMRGADSKRNSDSRVIFFRCSFFLLLRRQPSIPLLLVVVVVVATGTAFKSSQSSTFFCVFAPSSSLFFPPFFTFSATFFYEAERIGSQISTRSYCSGIQSEPKWAPHTLGPARKTALVAQEKDRHFTFLPNP